MNTINILLRALLILTVTIASSNAAEDLKAYYEEQKVEIVQTFRPPQLGSEVSVKLAIGQARSGILMKLNADSITLMTDTKMVTYKRTILHESSRAYFFPEDYAHVKALKKTREYKEQLHIEGVAEQQANTHDASLSVSSKLTKKSDRDVEEEERENKKTGNSTTITTTTRTYTQIQNLQITIANNTTHEDFYTLAWYFLGESTAGENVSIADSGTKKVSVNARSRIQEKVSSKPFVVEKVTVSRANSNYSGNKDDKENGMGRESAGWIVIVKYESEIVDKKASSKTYLTDEWINKF
ncbi:MAG: hypothetical protein V3V05_08115 [Pontiella sp.]